MIALLDNGQDLDECEREIGLPVGQLLTPLTRYRLRDPSRSWAIDNGGFKELDVPGLFSLLKREEHHRDNCLFVAVPDIVEGREARIHRMAPSPDRAKLRSKTYQGLADAMADQWGAYLRLFMEQAA